MYRLNGELSNSIETEQILDRTRGVLGYESVKE